MTQCLMHATTFYGDTCPRCAEESRRAVGDPIEEQTFGPLVNTVNPGTNPKDLIGSTKLPLELWPAEATAVGSLGMLEGALKYGRNNFVSGDGVVASIYVAAAKRHIDAWFEGEDNAPDSNSPHLGNALASLAILVKAQAHGKLVDDRNYSPFPGAYRRFIDSLTPHVTKLQELFKNKHPKHWTIQDNS